MAGTLTLLGINSIAGLRRSEVRTVPNTAYWQAALDAGYAILYLPGVLPPFRPAEGVLYGSDVGVTVAGLDGQGHVLDGDGDPILQSGTPGVGIASVTASGTTATVHYTDGTASTFELPVGEGGGGGGLALTETPPGSGLYVMVVSAGGGQTLTESPVGSGLFVME